MLYEVIETDFIQHKIHFLTAEKPTSVKEIASVIRIKPASALHYIVNMRRKNMIALDHVKRTTPFIQSLGD
ncbi:hypothetical protein HXY32_01840 [Candidatus Bathyarchaeota archaeon]|nr:hypothetical protein [Candidatus Bathyarchaeota archaeon]